jgi:hypothetical protein
MDEVCQKAANIGYMFPDFKEHYFGKAEENVGDVTIAIHRPKKDFLEREPIFKELLEKTDISLAHFIGLIEKQSMGEEGLLLVNGWANIAHIKSKKGELCAVYCGWRSKNCGWVVNACPVKSLRHWYTDNQVVSLDF